MWGSVCVCCKLLRRKNQDLQDSHATCNSPLALAETPQPPGSTASQAGNYTLLFVCRAFRIFITQFIKNESHTYSLV